jgi:predicted nucleic acid-binding protein
MKVLFDTDVTLDLLLDRRPHSESAAILFSKVERGEIEGYLCATTITTIHYLAAKVIGLSKARSFIRKLLSFLQIAAVDRAVLDRALDVKSPDYEDGVVSESASGIGADVIITRNIRDYRNSTIPACSPIELLKMIKSG